MSFDEANQKIKEEADWHCKHCMQVFDSFKEAQEHESTDEDNPHHISGEIDVLKVLAMLSNLQKIVKKELEKFPILSTSTPTFHYRRWKEAFEEKLLETKL